MTERAFLGTGWSFPIAFDASGEVATVSEEEDIRQSILIILRTNPGERVMRPEFGAGLRALLFEPINAATASRTKHRVERALIEWEPRIDGIAVGVTAARGVPRLDITVRYRVRSTNTFYNLVYPFYLREGRP
ncbi:MAG: GPW/gp25 family protein [Myxococcales bacterium]|nr:GPW/gp25 family protein [Myxococcales bacterium]